jgi:CheY-like chemotaxis protein
VPLLDPTRRSDSLSEIRPNLAGLRVLAADDHPAAREVLTRLFSAWGMQADVVPDGPTALQFLRAAQAAGSSYALALLDARMPAMDGVEVARAMRKDPALARVPIVLALPFGQSLDVGELGASTVNRLSKPVLESHLVRCVAATLGLAPPAPVLRDDLSESSSWAAARMAPMIPPRGDAGRLLVVEDNAVSRELALRILERLGYQVEVATNGLEAVERASRDLFDVVLMDCQMPEMDGYEAAAEIRRRERSPGRTRIVAVTAHALAEERKRCLDAGMDDFLPKPFQPAELASAVARWVPVARGEAAPQAGAKP